MGIFLVNKGTSGFTYNTLLIPKKNLFLANIVYSFNKNNEKEDILLKQVFFISNFKGTFNNRKELRVLTLGTYKE